MLIDDKEMFLHETRDVLRAGLAERRLDQRRRHRGAPSRPERNLHPDRQRALRLVRHDRLQEPPQFPGVAAGRPHRLCGQCRGAGLHAPARLAPACHRPFGRPSRQALRRRAVPGRAIFSASASRNSSSTASTRRGWPPKARCGAPSRRMACCPTPSSSAMMPASSRSHAMPCAGCMPSVWSTNSTPSATCTAKPRTHVRSLIWGFYRDLKAYKHEPSSRRKAQLKARFDRIFKRRTGFAMLDRLLKRLHANKAELLAVLDRPEIPAAHKRLRERHPLPGDQAQDQRRYAQRSRPRLSRCLSRPRPRPAASSASPSGTISAQGSPSQISPSSHPSQASSGFAALPPDCPDFCPCYSIAL